MYNLKIQDRAGVNWAWNFSQYVKWLNNKKEKNLDGNYLLKYSLEENTVSSLTVLVVIIKTGKKYETLYFL